MAMEDENKSENKSLNCLGINYWFWIEQSLVTSTVRLKMTKHQVDNLLLSSLDNVYSAHAGLFSVSEFQGGLNGRMGIALFYIIAFYYGRNHTLARWQFMTFLKSSLINSHSVRSFRWSSARMRTVMFENLSTNFLLISCPVISVC